MNKIMTLTVIIPAYNEEKYIQRTLESIKGFEVIVVCNGCTDNTALVAKKYGAKVIEIKEKGVSKARNTGAMHASNSKFVFLDADTLVSPTLLKKISISKSQIGATLVKADSKKVHDRMFMSLKSVINTLFNHSSGLVYCDKNIFERVGGFREDITKREDTFFIREATKHASFKIVNDYVYTSMRRYQQSGYSRMLFFWTREKLFPTSKEYESIR
jgi:glycosyltransferase involved in cell wall biosynthesis